MKKIFKSKLFYIILGIVLIAAIVLIVLLTNKEPVAPTLDLTPEIVDKNLIDKEAAVSKPVVKDDDSVSFNSNEVYDDSYLQYGLLVIKNDTGHVGFYSLQYNKFIIEREYYYAWIDYEVEFIKNLGYIIEFNYADINYVYDCFGNLLYSGKYPVVGNYSVISGSILYVVVSYYDQINGISYKGFKYSENGSATSLGSVEFVFDLEPDKEEIVRENIFNKSDKYVDIERLDLTNYGRPGYYLSIYEGLITIFDSNNKPIKTSYLPENAHTIGFVGDYLIYQMIFQLPSDAKDYEVSIGENKHSIKTYRLNLVDSSKEEEMDINYIIEDLVPYKDKEGKYSILLASIVEIDDYKVSTVNRIVFIDADGNILEDVSGINPKSFIKLGSNYFNITTNVLYDSNLEEIAYLDGISPSIELSTNTIIGKINGLYGVLDSNGNVLIPFELSYISNDVYDGITLGSKDGKDCFINLSNGTVVERSGSLTKKANGLYIEQSTDAIIFMDYTQSSGLTEYYRVESDGYLRLSSSDEIFTVYNNSLYHFYSVDFIDEGVRYVNYYTFTLNAYKKENISTVGTYNDTIEKDGITVPHDMVLSDEPIGTFFTPGNNNYYLFIPEVDGTYTINFGDTDDVTVKSVYLVANNTYLTVNRFKHTDYDIRDEWEDAGNYTYDLKAGEMYLFEIYNYTDAYFTYTFVKEDGSNIGAPVRFELNEEVNTLTFSDNTKYYRLISNYGIPFDISRGSDCQVYTLSDLTIQSVRLSSNTAYYISVKSTDEEVENHSIKFEANLDDYAYGSCQISPVRLNIGDAIQFSTYATSGYDNRRYFTYANTTSETVNLKLYVEGNNVRYSKVSFENALEQNSLNSLSINTISVNPGETIYGVCSTAFIALLGNSSETNTIGYVKVINNPEDSYYSYDILSEYDSERTIVLNSNASTHTPFKNSIYKFDANMTYYIISYLPSIYTESLLTNGFGIKLTSYNEVSLDVNNLDGGNVTLNDGSTTTTLNYQVKFDSNGGSLVPSQYLDLGNSLTYPEIPTKEGYIFAGWYSNSSLTNRFNFASTSIYNDITLYAKWVGNEGNDTFLTIGKEYTGLQTHYTGNGTTSDNYYYFVPLVTGRYTLSIDCIDSYSYYIYDEDGYRVYNYSGFDLQAGEAYYILVSSYTQGTTFDITINGSQTPEDGARVSYSARLGEDGITDIYTVGKELTLTATTYDGYEFKGWYIGEELISTELVYTYTTVDNSVSIEARFEEITE